MAKFSKPIFEHAEKFLSIERNLCHKLAAIPWNQKRVPAIYMYNPLEYASEPHANFVRLYCNTPKQILFLGMNPGPFGMCQTGVSGSRLWRLFYGDYACLSHDNCLVYNFCPLAFMDANGKNIPLKNIPAAVRNPVNEMCRSALIEVIKHFNIQVIVGIGNYAEVQANKALKEGNITGIQVYYLDHPSRIHIGNDEAWFNAARNSLQSLPNF